MREILVDSFAGGGGASTGIEMALGRSPDIAINHDKVALSVHAANHPLTKHMPHNIWKVDPRNACDRGAEGEPITKTDQIRLCGNSVCPQVAAALVAANYGEMEVTERGVPAFALVAAE